jgi:hypothetical protein
MSIQVEFSNLADALTHYRFAYLMTTTAQGTPHAVQVDAVLQDGVFVINNIGRRTRENASQRQAIGLVWPPKSELDYSLFVDGLATVVDAGLRITPTRAVLHRPAPEREPKRPGGCASDCVELDL